MRLLVPVFLRSLALFLFCAGGGGPFAEIALAKKPAEAALPVPPPQPVPTAVTARRGAQLEIPLKAYGVTREARFLIRTLPAKGQLSAPLADNRGGATVAYDPPADLGIKAEKFTYAVQNPAGVSAPAEVTITITDEAPKIVAPVTLDFPKVMAGTVSRKEIVIENTGGGVAAGELQMEAPWRIEGSPAYQLKGGARQTFKLVFAPVEGAVFRGDLRYTSQPDRVTSLRGEAESPVTIFPSSLVLTHAPGEAQRGGVVELTNQTKSELKLRLAAGARLKIPSEAVLPAEGKVAVTVSVEAADIAALAEEMTISGAGLTLRLPVSSTAVGPVLHALGEQGTLLLPPGSIPAGSTAEVVLVNLGGGSGYWKSETEPDLTATPAEVRLAPGARQAVSVRYASKGAGKIRSPLRFVGEGQTVELMVEGELTGGTENAAVQPAFAPRVAMTATTTIASPIGERGGDPATAGASAAEAVVSAPGSSVGGIGFHAVRGVGISAFTATSATISFPAALAESRPVRIEMRGLDLDESKKLHERWYPVAKSTFRTEGTRIFAEAHGLRPFTLYTLGITPAAALPGTPPLFQIDIRTARSPSWFTPLHIGLLALGALLAYFVWNKLRSP